MNHFIGKQTIEIRRRTKQDAFEYQQSVSRLYRESVLPALEKLFDRFSNEEVLISIEKLEINIGSVSEKDFLKGDFINKIIREIEEQLIKAKVSKTTEIKEISTRSGRFSGRLHFLKNGELPRLASIPSGDSGKDILDSIGLSAVAAEQFRRLLSQNETARRRLILQNTPEFLTHIVELFTGHPQSDLIRIFKGLEKARRLALRKSANEKEGRAVEQFFAEYFQSILKKNQSLSQKEIRNLVRKNFPKTNREFEIEFWETILKLLFVGSFKAKSDGYVPMIFNEKPTFRLLIPFLKKLKKEQPSEFQFFKKTPPIPKTNQSEIQAILNSKESENRNPIDSNLSESDDLLAFEPEPEEGRHIADAGLVMLHPFIFNLFENTGLTKEKKFKSDRDRQRALVMLHYLSSGNDQPAEYELTLPKLLCGVPFRTPVDAAIRLTKKQKVAADEMLEVVIEHWGALGKSSPDALREGFLRREGKLTRKSNGRYLQIERKTLDILLDKLPWGLGVIRTPAMKELLFVEWN